MWCPICKNEYREGITLCADCKVSLVDTLDETKEDYEILSEMEDESNAKKLISYLEYSNIPAFLETDEETGIFRVCVAKKMFKQAKKAFQAFYTVEITEELLNKKSSDTAADHKTSNDIAEDSDSMANSLKDQTQDFHNENFMEEDSVENQILDQTAAAFYSDTESSMPNQQTLSEMEKSVSNTSRGTYVSKAEKSSDYRSSGFTFTIFGVVGIIVMILHWAGVFQYFSTMSAIIVSIMFVAFLVIGIDCFRRAAKAKAESVEEERFVKELTGWLEQNLTFDELTNTDRQDMTEEANFLNRISEMKTVIKRQFGDLDPGFLDQFTEDYYDNHFTSNQL